MHTIIKCNYGENFRNLSLPCTEREIQLFCDSLALPNDAGTQIRVDHSHNNPQVDALLAGKEVRLDELNYLMKRLDSFDEGEMNTFCAAASGQKLSSLKDMINLTFNIHCYSLVDDFSDLDRLGKNLYLNFMGSVPTKEFSEFDGKAYVEKIMAENMQPLVTHYGLIYENGNQPQQVYNGRTFPAYWYEPNPITLGITYKGDTEYLYLPVEKSELDKALQRLDAESLDAVTWSVEEHSLPENLTNMVIREQFGYSALNQFAAVFKNMGNREVTALSELAAFAKITTSEQLKTLADCMYEFESFPGIHTAEEYGRYMICESGHFEYDENLADYIDFRAYGQDKISRETGAFTDRGYLLYHGYNQEMQNILSQTIGLKAKEMPEPQELKLYMPLNAVTYHDENGYGDLYQVDFEIEVYADELAAYEDEIRSAMQKRMHDSESERGLMKYYGHTDTVNAKVRKYVFEVEEVRGELMGVAVLTLNAPLDAAELEKIKETIEGQCSDGFGEGFEQQEIKCNGKEVYVSLWDAKDWSLKTAAEMGISEQSYKMQFGGM